METQYTDLTRHIVEWIKSPSSNGELILLKQRLNLSLSEELDNLEAQLNRPDVSIDQAAFIAWEKQYLGVVVKTIQDEKLHFALTKPSTHQFFSLVRAKLTDQDTEELAVVKSITQLTLMNQFQPIFNKAEALATQSMAYLQTMVEIATPKIKEKWNEIKDKVLSKKEGPKP